ncbi:MULTISPECIES: hypothetical protein [Rhodococcus]|uniref:Uncharacterized protein n=1 Tax=Rhodococcus ruber BKS 20-38 TaxID=1278076 RepID=M2YXY0_9NOCA|nr:MULTISPECIES: hypothetical protein [Rhodococcus]EME66850.1 hypothetical protein G352_02899 [Rhodococcus ruber BKS 20-38]QIX53925.1 hypothetical protein HFP48_30705 [Rhodococcus sp. DMU1]
MADVPDLSKLSNEQLEAIGNQVLRTLAKRLRSGPRADPIGPYDKHTSNHLRNTIVAEEESAPFFE